MSMPTPTEQHTNASTSERPLLEVRGLGTGYGETQVLWDISLDVMRGEVVALVGANGAGKSTLLSTLSGLLPAWEGAIVFAGRDITRERAERIVKLGLAQVPQGRRLFAGLTVEENLRLGAYTRRAGSLSGGEQQMCAIGRGLMARPDLLLVDELSLGLAPNIVDDLLAAVDNIHRQEHLSFLLVEQDVQIALERAHRAYVMESGHIVLSGRAADLLKSEQIRMAYLGE